MQIPDSPRGKAYPEARGLTPHPRLIKDILFVAKLDYYGARGANGDGAGRTVGDPCRRSLPSSAIKRGAEIGISRLYLDQHEPRKWKPIGSAAAKQRQEGPGRKKHGLIRLWRRPSASLAISEGFENALAWDQLRGMGFFGDTLAGEDIIMAAAVDLGNLAGKATGTVPHPLKDADGKPVQIANGGAGSRPAGP